MSTPRVLNKKTDTIPSDAVYIGRPSKWGNPFAMKTEADRDKVVEQYRNWLNNNPELINQAKTELKGKDLVCYCSPRACHGNVLIKVANEMTDTIQEAFNPMEEGVTHINAYSKSHTALGKALSNFAAIGFNHPEFGKFASAEGFWYWASTGKKHEHLRELTGFKAKEAGKKLEKVTNHNFIKEVEEVLRLKIIQNSWLHDDFKKSTLPIVHYYRYGDGVDSKVVWDSTSPWFRKFYQDLRDKENGIVKKRGLRVIIAGSRDITDYKLVCEAVKDSQFSIDEVVSGGARGVDTLAERYAKDNGIPFKVFKADWDNNGKAAGFIRNEEMAEYADALVSLMIGTTPGSADMRDRMRKHEKAIYEVNLPPASKTVVTVDDVAFNI